MDLKKISIEEGTSSSILEDAQYLHKTIWGLDALEMTPSHIYVAAQQCGGRVLCAYHNHQPVGFIFGFPGIEENQKPYFYIHNIGVLIEYRNQGIGFLLKFKLRQLLLEAGFRIVKWTYDPLDSKNAYLYTRKLGCISNTYLKNYYGEMRDALNKEMPSDRLIMHWCIASNRVQKVLNEESLKLTLKDIEENTILNSIHKIQDYYLEPVVLNIDIDSLLNMGKQQFYLEIPSDYNKLKTTSFELALNWRVHVRKMMTLCFSKNLYITNAIFEHNRFFYVFESLDQLTNLG